MSKTTKGISRLFKHQDEFKHSGYLGSLLLFSDLNDAEKLFLSRSLMQLIKIVPTRDPHELFAEICFSWGVMCPHPEIKQEFMSTYSRCGACKSLVILNLRDNKNIEKVS